MNSTEADTELFFEQMLAMTPYTPHQVSPPHEPYFHVEPEFSHLFGITPVSTPPEMPELDSKHLVGTTQASQPPSTQVFDTDGSVSPRTTIVCGLEMSLETSTRQALGQEATDTFISASSQVIGMNIQLQIMQFMAEDQRLAVEAGRLEQEIRQLTMRIQSLNPRWNMGQVSNLSNVRWHNDYQLNVVNNRRLQLHASIRNLMDMSYQTECRAVI